MSLMSPPLALGQIVHEVIEGLSVLPVDKRFEEPLLAKFETAWQKISGKRGGFLDKTIENQYKQRGQEMLKKVEKNPGPLKKLAVKIKMDLPRFWLPEKDNIILCGKIDWLEYLPAKTGLEKEDAGPGLCDWRQQGGEKYRPCHRTGGIRGQTDIISHIRGRL